MKEAAAPSPIAETDNEVGVKEEEDADGGVIVDKTDSAPETAVESSSLTITVGISAANFRAAQQEQGGDLEENATVAETAAAESNPITALAIIPAANLAAAPEIEDREHLNFFSSWSAPLERNKSGSFAAPGLKRTHTDFDSCTPAHYRPLWASQDL